ncbi:Type IV secretion system protein virB10 [Phocoenobacter uteri]|uniref:Type IV secretion system protein virB10 n=1 Tax=Phocoenobacter uteri TaxID=146806 RepID=A0A379DEL9_9PAST|nr:TrbI/VirB10 family protein [Phocoenobacter uteri]MDG6882812.1 hypothetical protein [Phocoenobacter uteri]MDG6882851.1 hypothetical protein [Phocoenobacter uteri]SUB76404.1 Type IV secretion system protein virB10 [Phocoenobacter uteri]
MNLFKKQQIDDMSPNSSPSKTSSLGGVKRANKVPLIIIGILGVLFLIVMAIVSLERANNQISEPSKKDDSTGYFKDTSQYANSILKNAPSGVVKSSQKTPENNISPEKSNIKQNKEGANQQAIDIPTIPDKPTIIYKDRDIDPYKEELLRAQRERERNAQYSKSNVSDFNSNFSSNGSSENLTRDEMLSQMAAIRRQATEASSSADATASYQEQMRMVQAQMVGATENNISNSEYTTFSNNQGQNDIQQFNGSSSRWNINAPLETPKPFELRAGFVIPAVMISGINSDLPGQILAQVSQNIFDTATGKYLLIPQGARLVGKYTSDIAYGQERVLVAWQRIIYPDGRAQDIGSMPGSDSSGYAGFNDQVNNHYFRIFSSALLMSGITAGVSYSQKNSSSSNKESAGDILSQSLGQNMGQVIVQMLQKNINIAPTLEIRPGYQFNVVVVKDLSFKSPYKNYAY